MGSGKQAVSIIRKALSNPIWPANLQSRMHFYLCIVQYVEGTEDRLKKAHTRLIEWEERMRRINRVNVRIEILALLALVCCKQRDEAAALEHLQTALELAEPGGWIRTFVDLGMPMIDVLKILVEHQPGHGYAQQTLEACRAERRRKASSEPHATSKPRINERPPYHPLSRREIEIIPLLAEGLSNKEIDTGNYTC